MNKFLDAYNQPKLNQKDINNPNRPITGKEIDKVIKNHPTKKSQDLINSWLNFTKLLK
jgi:hypothetical protein